MADEFVRVAGVSEVPAGKMKCVEVAGMRILLANVDGTFYATDNMCTHEDASLCTGALKGHFVKCPLHGRRFDLFTGEAQVYPAVEPLRTFAVKLESDSVWVAVTD